MLVSSSVIIVSSLASLLTGGPLYDLGGHLWCGINWFFGIWFYVFSVVNSFALAIYRMVVMRYGRTTILSLMKLSSALYFD